MKGVAMWQWLKDVFSWLVAKLVEICNWILAAIYNIIFDFAVMVFDSIVYLLCIAINLFPELDLSKYESGFERVINYVDAFNDLLPIYESFFCVCFLLTYYFVFTLIRVGLKLIPGIG